SNDFVRDRGVLGLAPSLRESLAPMVGLPRTANLLAVLAGFAHLLAVRGAAAQCSPQGWDGPSPNSPNGLGGDSPVMPSVQVVRRTPTEAAAIPKDGGIVFRITWSIPEDDLRSRLHIVVKKDGNGLGGSLRYSIGSYWI